MFQVGATYAAERDRYRSSAKLPRMMVVDQSIIHLLQPGQHVRDDAANMYPTFTFRGTDHESFSTVVIVEGADVNTHLKQPSSVTDTYDCTV